MTKRELVTRARLFRTTKEQIRACLTGANLQDWDSAPCDQTHYAHIVIDGGLSVSGAAQLYVQNNR